MAFEKQKTKKKSFYEEKKKGNMKRKNIYHTL
jgi:hypothetical protein